MRNYSCQTRSSRCDFVPRQLSVDFFIYPRTETSAPFVMRPNEQRARDLPLLSGIVSRRKREAEQQRIDDAVSFADDFTFWRRHGLSLLQESLHREKERLEEERRYVHEQRRSLSEVFGAVPSAVTLVTTLVRRSKSTRNGRKSNATNSCSRTSDGSSIASGGS